MKKVISIAIAVVATMFICATPSFSSYDDKVITEDSLTLTQSQKSAISEVYYNSCKYLEMPDNKAETYDEMITIIRCADLKDDAGDVLPECPAYDEIKTIIWPNGYRKF